MHDIRALRADPAGFDAAMARRGIEPVADEILAIDTGRRAALTEAQEAQARRNALARSIGEGKRTGADTSAAEAEAASLRASMEALEARAAALQADLSARLAPLPNRLDDDVPDGADEQANVELSRTGAPTNADPSLRQHFELGEALGMMDFASAARIAGSRFTVLRGPLARLERAIGQFMIDHATERFGYIEMSVPSLVNDATMFGTGQLPKFADDLFHTTDGRWLIPTAEVPLTNMAAGQIIDAKSLPMRLTALTDCFRAEAGAAGRDTRGMLRQHQFRKVELVSVVAPEDSDTEHERMTQAAEAVLTALGLVHRRMLLCTGDTGFSAAKTYDLEVWLPGQGAWREISSCSNCRDFQARRMNARMRTEGGKSPVFVHTLNGSGVAVGRALIAVMEQGQQADGSILLPAALHPYLGGASRLTTTGLV